MGILDRLCFKIKMAVKARFHKSGIIEGKWWFHNMSTFLRYILH